MNVTYATPTESVEIDKGNPWLDIYPPEELCCENGRCAVCDAPIGEHLTTNADGYDRGCWIPPWQTPDGRYVCEDCAIAVDNGESI